VSEAEDRTSRAWTPGDRLPGPRRVTGPGSVSGRGASGPRVGVLALQGDVLEHLRALERCDAVAIEVRTLDALADVDGLVVPGGESTTIGRLLERSGLGRAIRARIDAGMPVMGTCAGMILLSDALAQNADQPRIGGLAVRTERNAFGRQRASFDARITVTGIDGGPMDVSFIRAPRVVEVLDPAVEVLADIDGFPVVVRQGPLLATAFHPEVTGDDRLHALFVHGLTAGAGK
jgi:pyridoxal 5'-phosphate synthase pdxT subunit